MTGVRVSSLLGSIGSGVAALEEVGVPHLGQIAIPGARIVPHEGQFIVRSSFHIVFSQLDSITVSRERRISAFYPRSFDYNWLYKSYITCNDNLHKKSKATGHHCQRRRDQSP
jgi:hypothetical protein